MTYTEFLNCEKYYVHHKVKFTVRWKSNNQIHTMERFIWDENSFKELNEDSPFEIIKVEIRK